MTNINNHELIIQLSQQAHQDAHAFAAQQSTPEKVKQVYTNTLAIYAVRHFLQWLGIETDLNAGESWNSVIRRFQNVADLVIPDLGTIECRPVLPGETVISLPPEVTEDRIAYIAVQFQEQLGEVQLLGFYPTLDPQTPPEEIEIANLQPIETLIDYLDRLESARDLLESNEEVARKVREELAELSISEIVAQLERIYRSNNRSEWQTAGGEFLASYLPTAEGFAFRGSTPVMGAQQSNLQDLAKELLEKLDEVWGTVVSIPGKIKLSSWLRNIDSLLESGFQNLETFLNSLQGNQVFRFATAPRSRSAETEETFISVTGVKEIQLEEHRLTLVVSCHLESPPTTDIVLRLYPTGENTCLPPGVNLIVLDESGEIFLEATARSADNWMQLEFAGESEENFKVKVALGDTNVIHDFVI